MSYESSSDKYTHQESFEFYKAHEPPVRGDFFKEIVGQLRTIRHRRKLPLEKLNIRLGMARNYVHKWECGMKTPTGFNLYEWAKKLDAEILILDTHEINNFTDRVTTLCKKKNTKA